MLAIVEIFLKKIEYIISRLLHKVQRMNDSKSKVTMQNSPEEWEKIYLKEIKPVISRSSPITKALLELLPMEDSFIEIGCGSSIISAELAIARKTITLCDFSTAILKQAINLFEISHLPNPDTIVADMLKPLPIADNKYNVVWSSGVLEHWDDDEVVRILCEMRRISNKYIVSFVPNASCVFYRTAKYISEQKGTWIYGKEIPRVTLTNVFEAAGLVNIKEKIIANTMVGPWIRTLFGHNYPELQKWWLSLDESDPVKNNQGYLLMTIGNS